MTKYQNTLDEHALQRQITSDHQLAHLREVILNPVLEAQVRERARRALGACAPSPFLLPQTRTSREECGRCRWTSTELDFCHSGNTQVQFCAMRQHSGSENE